MTRAAFADGAARGDGPAGAEHEVAIRLRGLVQGYGGAPVLAGLDLDVGAGRVVALHGPNGAGKTTLLRLLGTRLRPAAGTATVHGFDVVREAHEVRARVASLPVFGGAYGALSGRENLRLAAALRGLAPEVVDVAGLLDRVGLTRAGDHLVRAYSSGMRKRLALARLLLTDAPVWLLDEPYAALDEDGQALVDTLVADARREGRTVLLASHDLPRSRGTADAIVEVAGGRLRVVAHLGEGARS
ncbi:MAG: heme ABC exporter ATP-binding protein CcmA [Trueperaceae bacterium]|nr:heme ABC exporter ATP-binding protein CcmA [Trueperaceae bacterium]